MVEDNDTPATGEVQEADDNEPIPAMQRMMDSPFLLLFLGVTIPTVFYLIWGLIEIAHVPIAPAYAATAESQPSNVTIVATAETASPPIQSNQTLEAAKSIAADSTDIASEVASAAGATPAAANQPAPVEEVASLATRLANADANNGQKIARRCLVCHSTEQGDANRVGPNLWDVVGRDIGAGDGFRYSPALSPDKGAWTFETLDLYLADPRATFRGNRMADPGIDDADDRADVILYLRNLSGTPQPLPG